MKHLIWLNLAAVGLACECWSDRAACIGEEPWCTNMAKIARTNHEGNCTCYYYNGIPTCYHLPVNSTKPAHVLCGNIREWFYNDDCICLYQSWEVKDVKCYRVRTDTPCSLKEAIYPEQDMDDIRA